MSINSAQNYFASNFPCLFSAYFFEIPVYLYIIHNFLQIACERLGQQSKWSIFATQQFYIFDDEFAALEKNVDNVYMSTTSVRKYQYTKKIHSRNALDILPLLIPLLLT